MKEILENKKILYVIGGLVFIVVVVLVLISVSGGGISLDPSNPDGISKIEARNGNGNESLIVHKDGRVEIRKGSDVFNEYWTKGKVDAFYAYYDQTYGDSAIEANGTGSFSYEEDELIGAIIDGSAGGSGSGGSGGSGGGQDISNLFNTPTPAPGGSGGSGSGGTFRTPTPTPSTPEKEPWCLYWRLSYCVIAYKTPLPSGASATPAANILPPSCPENQLTGRTVIGDELCFTTPTPFPTP